MMIRRLWRLDERLSRLKGASINARRKTHNLKLKGTAINSKCVTPAQAGIQFFMN